MDIQTKDGILLRGIPDGTPDEEIKARIQKIRAESARPAEPAKPLIVPEQNMSALEKFAAKLPSFLTSGDRQVRGFVQGAADPSVGAFQLAANAVGPQLDPLLGNQKNLSDLITGESRTIAGRVNKAIQKQDAEYKAKQGEGFDGSRILGNMLSPANILLFKGASPAMPATLSGRMGVASLMGAAGGAMNPETGDDYATEKAKSIAGGAVLGPLVEATGTGVGKVSKALWNMIEPNIGRGKQAAARLANEVAGDRQQQIVQAIKSYLAEIPGEQANAGKAALGAGSAEFSALQKIADEIKPSVATDMVAANQAARRSALQTVGQDEAALAAAIKARSQAVDPLYEAARKGGSMVKPDISPIINDIDTLLAKNPGNKELVSVVSGIRQGLVNQEGKARTNPEQIMSVIPTINAALKNPDNAFIQGQLVNLKDSIVKAVPGLERANAEFAAKSVPVNQMQIGQFLEDKLVKPLETGERAGVFAQAMRDAPGTIKKSTGQARYDKLDKVLDPSQMKVVDAVMKSLQSEQTLANLAKEGGPKARKIVGEITAPSTAPNWLDATITLINNAAKRIGYRGKEFTMNELADMMQKNPQELARLMENATPKERSAIMQAATIYGYQLAPQVGE